MAPMRTDIRTCGKWLTRGLEAFGFLGLEEAGLMAGIVPVIGGKEVLEDKILVGGAPWEAVSRGKGRKRGANNHGDSAHSYIPVFGDPSFKFWTHETTYPFEHLREPTVSPQTEWGQGDGHGEANREAMEGHGWSRRFGSVKFAFMGKKTWQRPWHRQDVPYNIQFVVWQR